jgi:hypothetical protein
MKQRDYDPNRMAVITKYLGSLLGSLTPTSVGVDAPLGVLSFRSYQKSGYFSKCSNTEKKVGKQNAASALSIRLSLHLRNSFGRDCDIPPSSP